MKDPRASLNVVAISANNRETDLNTEQTLDTALLVGDGDLIQFEPLRETDEGLATGKEEASIVYNRGGTASWAPSFERAQPQHFAFLLAYGLGSVSTVAAGTGKEHTITPLTGRLDGSRDLPTLTAGQRLGKSITKQRFASLAVDSISEKYARNEWCQISGQLKGTGKMTSNIVEETVNAADNVTQLTLAANGVEGADAATRLDNVHRIMVELSAGVWTEVDYSAVSSATPAVIDITAPGATATVVNYKILYVATESGWMTLPAMISETPLHIAQCDLTIGGAWDGSAFQGGRKMNVELNSLEINTANNLQVDFVPGVSDLYAGSITRDRRVQTITLNREARDYILQHYLHGNETFGIHLLAQGAEYEAGHNYQVERIFPKVGILKAPLSVNGKKLAEAGDLIVLDGGTYPTSIARIKNKQVGYAA
jgi:hypothetical protein